MVDYLSTEKRQFTLRMQEENFLKIKHISEQERRSIAMQIEYVVEKYIANFEANHGPIVIEEDQ